VQLWEKDLKFSTGQVCLALVDLESLVASVHRQTAFAMLLVGLLMLTMPHLSANAYAEEGQVTIVFDMSHDQSFSPLKHNFTQAVDFFRNHTEYFIRIHSAGELSAQNLSRARILVVTNPARNFSSTELQVVSNFVASGGALFLLGDYQVTERRIGNPAALNQILERLPEDRIRFTTVRYANQTQGDAVVDAAHNLTLPFNVRIDGTGITAETRETIGLGVGEVLLAGGSLATNWTDSIVSRGASTSQAVAINGDVIAGQPAWLAAFWIGSARIVLCTSTTMFSDTVCVGLNQTWFQSVDNRVLWYNIFKWLSAPLVLNPAPIMIAFVALAFLVGLGLFGYSFWLKKRGR